MRLLFNSAVAVGILAIVNPLGARALPQWSGHCNAGAFISGKGAHSTSDKSVEDLNLVVKLKPADALADVPLDPDITRTVDAGESYFLIIDGSGANQAFKGFLFRLSDRSGGGANVANDLVVPGSADPPILKLESDGEGELASADEPPICAEGVAGVCHSNNVGAPAAPRFTESIDFKPSSAGELLLEVTVVVQKGADNWGFSAYNFTVNGQPTSAPSSSPSSMPSVSMAPSPPPVTKSPVAPTSGGNTITNKITFIVAAFTTGMAWLFL